MRIAPNQTVLEGTVTSVEPAPDGWGADVQLEVKKSSPAKGSEDFLRAEPGSTITLFTAEPDNVEVGRAYKVTATINGGPKGERAVIQKVAPKR